MHGENFIIGRNSKLVECLRGKIKEGLIDIVQHGYAHTSIAGRHEFAISDFQQVDRMLLKGREILEDTFKCRVSVFAAPHDAVSRATMKSLKKNGMCLCRRFTLGRLLSVSPISTLKAAALVKTAFRSGNLRRVIPTTVITATGVPIIQWNAYFSPNVSINGQMGKAKKLLRQKKMQKDPFVLMHHHWEYFADTTGNVAKTDQLELFNSFLDFAAKENVAKASLSDICECLREHC
jgi:hypothetical protein